jgi:hypothetical protein
MLILTNLTKINLDHFLSSVSKCSYLMLIRDESVYHVWDVSIIWRLCLAKKDRVGARRKGRPFITWGQPQPLICNLNGRSQPKNCNPTMSPQHLSWDLPWFFPTYSLVFVQNVKAHIHDVITQVQDVIP